MYLQRKFAFNAKAIKSKEAVLIIRIMEKVFAMRKRVQDPDYAIFELEKKARLNR
jgi:hypothetical protein